MPTVVSNVRLWTDCGYADGSTELPPIGHKLRDPTLTLDGPFAVAKDRVFDELQVPEDFNVLRTMNYLAMDLELKTGTKTYYGWIDSVSLRSDSENAPISVIRWHVDHWRTWNGSMAFGSGMVVRRPRRGFPHDMWQGLAYNNLVIGNKYPLFTEMAAGLKWVIVSAVTKEDNKSFIRYLVWPIGHAADYNVKRGDVSGIAPRFGVVETGLMDEALGLDPQTIAGVWMCPVCPLKQITRTDDTFIHTDPEWNIYTHDYGNEKYAAFTTTIVTEDAFRDTWSQFEHAIESTELSRLIAVGCDGSQFGAIPFDKSIHVYNWHVRMSATDCCIRIRFGDATIQADGLTLDVPLPMFDVNSNAWSSYNYSGQRDYERQMRTLRTFSGTVEGSTSTLMSGAMLGGMAGVAGGPIGMSAGALIGAGAGLIKGGMDFFVMNDRYQAEEDHLHARQSEGMLMTGHAADDVRFGMMPSIVELVPDNKADLIASMEVSGVSWGKNMPDCSSLIAAGGPMQIINLIVRGAVPAEARNWTKQRFAGGVRIVAR